MKGPSPLVPFHLEGEDPPYLVVCGLLFDVLSGKSGPGCRAPCRVCTTSKQSRQVRGASGARHLPLSHLPATSHALPPCRL